MASVLSAVEIWLLMAWLVMTCQKIDRILLFIGKCLGTASIVLVPEYLIIKQKSVGRAANAMGSLARKIVRLNGQYRHLAILYFLLIKLSALYDNVYKV